MKSKFPASELRFLDLEALAFVGLDAARYGQLSYETKHAEYPRSQDIGRAAHFLDLDGLIVPSACLGCLNAVLFCIRISPEHMTIKADLGSVKWEHWQ